MGIGVYCWCLLYLSLIAAYSSSILRPISPARGRGVVGVVGGFAEAEAEAEEAW